MESCTSDMVSFEDALEDYNRYASETGKTARSAHRQAAEVAHVLSHSPLPSPKVADGKHGKKEKQKKKKKKQRHGYTVASIDADTIREVKKLAERGKTKRNTSDSKVNQLAREYSRRIKDLNKPVRRVPTVTEEETPPGTPEAIKPVWLSDLNQRRQQTSLEDILDHMRGAGQEGGGNVDDEETGSISSNHSTDIPSEPRPLTRPLSNDNLANLDPEDLDRQALQKPYSSSKPLFEGAEFREEAGEEEVQKKKRFRGWVRSLAARFGGRKEQGTTL